MGQSNTKADSDGAVAVNDRADLDGREITPENPQKEMPKLGERRTSFYETVDASEVLSYLIIGKPSRFHRH